MAETVVKEVGRGCSMSRIIVESSSTAQWQKLVHEAEAACDLQLNEDMESYLVFLLMRFLEKPEFTSKIMAMDYLHSFLANGQVQQEKLRDVGDHCLLFSGLFPKIAERRQVQISYYVGMGKTAYHHLADTCKTQLNEFYHQLAECFVHLMDILHVIRGFDQQSQILSPLEALELWGDTQSEQALKSLRLATSANPFIDGSGHKH